ncbi:MAG: hypothetical protein AABW41_02640 [Nanoarchaeota archaeon]
MAIKQIFATLIIVFLFLVTFSYFSYAAECEDSFYLYNFKYSNGDLAYIGRSLQKGCMPGNVQEESYKFNIVKEDSIVYSYWFNPSKRFSDAIVNNEITGGVEIVKESTISVAAPIIDYNKISVLNEKGQELIFLNKEQIEEAEKKQAEQFSIIDYVNNLMRSLLRQLFGPE